MGKGSSLPLVGYCQVMRTEVMLMKNNWTSVGAGILGSVMKWFKYNHYLSLPYNSLRLMHTTSTNTSHCRLSKMLPWVKNSQTTKADKPGTSKLCLLSSCTRQCHVPPISYPALVTWWCTASNAHAHLWKDLAENLVVSYQKCLQSSGEAFRRVRPCIEVSCLEGW